MSTVTLPSFPVNSIEEARWFTVEIVPSHRILLNSISVSIKSKAALVSSGCYFSIDGVTSNFTVDSSNAGYKVKTANFDGGVFLEAGTTYILTLGMQASISFMCDRVGNFHTGSPKAGTDGVSFSYSNARWREFAADGSDQTTNGPFPSITIDYSQYTVPDGTVYTLSDSSLWEAYTDSYDPSPFVPPLPSRTGAYIIPTEDAWTVGYTYQSEEEESPGFYQYDVFLMKFNLASIPSDAVITNATLRFRGGGAASFDWTLARVTNSWTSGTSGTVSFSGTNVTSVTLNSGSYKTIRDIDVTDLVLDILSSGGTLALRGPTSSGFSSDVAYVQGGTSAVIPPSLYIEWTVPVDETPPTITSTSGYSYTNSTSGIRRVWAYGVTDSESGVAGVNTTYTSPGGSAASITSYASGSDFYVDIPLTSTQGEWSVAFIAVDNAGNSSTPATSKFFIDSQLANDPAPFAVWHQTTATIYWIGFSDPTPSSGYQNTRIWLGEWNGGNWVGGSPNIYNGSIVTTNPFTLEQPVSSLTAGKRYRYTVAHYDNADNQSSYTWYEFVTKKQIGTFKMSTGAGNVTLPVYDPSSGVLGNKALRIETPLGIGCFEIISTMGLPAKSLRVDTLSGIKAIATL